MQELKALNPLINNILKNDAFIEDKPYLITEHCDVFGFCLDQNVYRKWESDIERSSIFRSMIRNENWNNPGGVSLMLRTFHVTNQFSSFINSEFGLVSVDKLRDSMKEYQVVKLVERSKVFLENRQISSALKSLDTAIQIIPNFTTALKYRAHIYIQSGNFLDAKKDIMVILSESPDDIEGLKLWTALPKSLTSDDSAVICHRYMPTIHRLSESLESTRKSSASDSSTSSSSDSARSRNSDDSFDSKDKNKRRKHKKRRKSKHKRKENSKRAKKHKKDTR